MPFGAATYKETKGEEVMSDSFVKPGEDLPKIASGKTKDVYLLKEGETENVLVVSREDLTAGDGKRHIVLPGKDEIANWTICNYFRFIAKTCPDVPLSFINQVNDTSFRARRLDMLRVEFVTRIIVTGSAIKRYNIPEGTHVRYLDEMFYKDDKLGDPLILFNEQTQWYDMYDPKKPVSSETYLGEVPRTALMPTPEQKDQIWKHQHTIFDALIPAWEHENAVIADGKLEWGLYKGKVMLGDEISNDSCRIWEEGKKEQRKDKDIFRMMEFEEEISEKQAEMLLDGFRWTMEATSRFPGNWKANKSKKADETKLAAA